MTVYRLKDTTTFRPGGTPTGILAARLELSANYTLPSGTSQTVPWDDVIFDDLGVTGHRSYAFVIQEDGLYEVSSRVQVGVGGTGIRDAGITMNGTTDVAIGQIAYPTGFIADGAWFNVTTGVNKYTAGAYFTVFILSDSGEDVDGGAGTSYNNFTIIRYA